MTVETVPQVGDRAREQSRARYPDREGFVTRDGVRVHYEVYGEGDPVIVLLPTWSVVHSRFWKCQIPYLARHARVVTFDGRGNGRSDRPEGIEAYLVPEFVADTLAVMDAAEVDRAYLVSVSCGALWATELAAAHPERVAGSVYIGPAVGLAPPHPERAMFQLDEEYETEDGWAKYNTAYWTRAYEPFLEFFFGELFPEPHSTKQIEDCIGWGLETTPEILSNTTRAISRYPIERLREACRTMTCPTLVIHGDDDRIRPHAQGAALAEATRGSLVTIEGGGHAPNTRDPVRVNLLLRDFAAPAPPVRRWTTARSRARRALFVSSPIGLGHARRDIAIADELRVLQPGLEIDWLAQPPVTTVLQERGERIHPASAYLASETGHFESESAEHDLHCFQAFRRMDEILVANFMVFHDVASEERYDLWVGDEAWDLDYFLHENPELKTAAYAWLTDFVGFLPMADGGDAEAALTADYNAEMIEHIARFPRLRDRALFVGDAEDVVAKSFGPGLPDIPTWTEAHYDFTGYVTGYDPVSVADRQALRAELGFGEDEVVCVVAVGGTGVGAGLLRRVVAAFPAASALVPGLRMIAVAGPRIDPASLGAPRGVEVRAYVPDLYRHLAACDVAVVQGGLTTAMELTANQRPFLYFPLAHHFEQQVHVRHRLERHGAGRPMDFSCHGPEEIAAAIAEEVRRDVAYRPVDPDGARRAAVALADLV